MRRRERNVTGMRAAWSLILGPEAYRRQGLLASRGRILTSTGGPTMDERELAESLRRVREGSLDRRQFARTLLGLGLTAPMIAELLGPWPGHAQAKRSIFTPARRGGGELKTLWWQAPTILNPHLATGAKDADASRIFYEGLVSFDPDGTIVPNLTAEIPTIENGGVARDRLSIIVKLKKGVQWHDGQPFTVDDGV